MQPSCCASIECVYSSTWQVQLRRLILIMMVSLMTQFRICVCDTSQQVKTHTVNPNMLSESITTTSDSNIQRTITCNQQVQRQRLTYGHSWS